MYSIVIPTYNHLEDCLIPCIESLKKYTELSRQDIEIIIVANGCVDGTKEYLAAEKQIDKIIWVDDACGFPIAVNKGIEAAKGKYIVLLNNDTVLLDQKTNSWLEILREPFLKDPSVGITGPMLTMNVPGVNRIFLIFFCAMISREVIQKIGLLDESFSPGFGEDCDFCWRAEDAGYKLIQVPDNSSFEPSANFRVGSFPIYHKGNLTFKEAGKSVSEAFTRNLARLKEMYGADLDKAMSLDGYMPIAELHWLARAAQKHNKILEIGSWHGKSTRALADNTSGKVFAVDHWQGSSNEPENHFSAAWEEGDHAFMEFFSGNKDLITSGKILPLRMRSFNACKTLQQLNEKFDMIFIDGEHTYDGVKKDVIGCLPLLANGGLICGHDYGAWAGVKEAVDESLNIDGIFHTIWFKEFGEVDAGNTSEKPKVFDCFLFYNELELLELRLNELDPVVDEFIILESPITTTGQPKPLYFTENRERFSKFLHKIRCIILNDLPTDGDTWARERFARDKFNSLVTGKDTDIVIISDLDEIPSAEAVKKYKPEMGLMSFDQKLYYYWLNCYNDQWDWAKILSVGLFKTMTACQVRYTKAPSIEGPGGWHFSFQGGVDRIMQKISAWTHSEYNRPDINNKEHIENCINTPCDVLKRENIPMKFVGLDESFPKFVLDNQDTIFKGWIKKVNPMIEVSNKEKPVAELKRGVTAYISTKDRYFSSLPLAINSIISQSLKPNKLVIYDDGEQKNLTNEPLYLQLFKMLEINSIEWEVRFGPKIGQVKNHQSMLDTAETEYLWRLDDDNVANPDVLETLVNYLDTNPKVGAVGGCVIDPNRPIICNPAVASSNLADIYLGANAQWYKYTEHSPKHVEHLYSTFLYRVEAGKHGYNESLSPAGHREETMFTYEMIRNGWELVFLPGVTTWHFRNNSGGIRSFIYQDYWLRDEQIFQSKLREWGIKTNSYKFFLNKGGLGDHFAMKKAIMNHVDKLSGIIPVVFTTYPGIFGDIGLVEASVAEGALLLGSDEVHNVYHFMADKGWDKKLYQAYEQMYFGELR